MTTTLLNDPELAQEAWEAFPDLTRYRDGLIVGQCERSLLHYLKLVRINGCHGPVRFGKVMEPWQRDSTVPIMRAIEGVAGHNPNYTGPTCFWRDLPQGHDKTSSIARILNGALAFSRKPLRIAVFARDRIQAGLIYDFMKDEAALNPWLGRRLQFMADGMVRGYKGLGRVQLYASDYASAAGLKYDIGICEEVTWWPEKGELLFDQVYTRRMKIHGAVFVVLGNAGIQKTWQHSRYELYKKDLEWDIFRTEGSIASWIPADKLRRDRRSVTPSLARRLYDNEWIADSELTYLTRADLDACMTRSRELGVRLLDKADPGIKYVAAVDYGATNDWTAMAVVGIYDDRIHVVKLDVLRARDFPTGRVPTSRVRDWIIKQHEAFNPTYVFDPFQMEAIIQEFELRYPVFRHEYHGGKTNFRMAETVRSLVVNQRLLWPADAGLVTVENGAGEWVPYPLEDEFHDLVTVDIPAYGYRFDHRSGKHDDRAVAVAMAAFFATQVDQSKPFPTVGVIPRLSIRRDPMANLSAQVDKYNCYGSS